MKLQFIIPSILLGIFCLLFASSAFAQAPDSGLDIRIGLGADLLRVNYSYEASYGDESRKVSFKDPLALNGVLGKISLGYRWTYFGIYFDQDLGGVKWDSKNPGIKVSGDDSEFASDSGGAINYEDSMHFIGGSYLSFRGILPILPNFQIDLGVGFGVVYGDGDDAEDEFKDDYKPSIYVDEDGRNTALFSMKFSLAFTYYLNETFGLSAFLDYNLTFDSYSIEIFDYKQENTTFYHNINPGLMAVIRL